MFDIYKKTIISIVIIIINIIGYTNLLMKGRCFPMKERSLFNIFSSSFL